MSSLSTLIKLGFGIILGAVCAGCGIIDDGSDDEQEGLSSCEDGTQRISQTPCTGISSTESRAIEYCENQEWRLSDECVIEPECVDGTETLTGEMCGTKLFNHEVIRCAGGLWQEPECRCGSARSPHEGWTVYDNIQEQKDADALAGIVYPWRMYFEDGDPTVTGLDHVRCVDEMISADGVALPSLKNLEAAGYLDLRTADASGLPALKYVGYLGLSIRSPTAQGLEGLIEVEGQLTVWGLVETLSGLEGLRSVGNVYLSGDTLTDISALSGITVIRGFLDTRDSSQLVDLRGLENVQEIQGDMNVRIASLDQLRVFDSLQSVQGVAALAAPIEIACEVVSYFGAKDVAGGVLVNGKTSQQNKCD